MAMAQCQHQIPLVNTKRYCFCVSTLLCSLGILKSSCGTLFLFFQSPYSGCVILSLRFFLLVNHKGNFWRDLSGLTLTSERIIYHSLAYRVWCSPVHRHFVKAFHHMLEGHFQYLDKERHSSLISHSQTLPVEMVFLYKVTLILLVSK